MKRTKTKPTLFEQVIDTFADCLTPESAKRILAIKADENHIARVKYLGEQCNEGLLTEAENAEYGQLIDLGTQLSILKSKARQLLARTAEV